MFDRFFSGHEESCFEGSNQFGWVTLHLQDAALTQGQNCDQKVKIFFNLFKMKLI